MGRMSRMAREEYLKKVAEAYLKADKKTKGILLDECMRNTSMNRKYLIRKLRGIILGRAPTSKGLRKRGRHYGAEVDRALKTLWEIFDYPCSLRLKSSREQELGRLIAFGELQVDKETQEKLYKISPSTIDRHLRPYKGLIFYHRKGRRGSKASCLRREVPVRVGRGRGEVGEMEVDMVAFCGSSYMGEFVNVISAVEVCTGWWEGEGVMGRSQQATHEALQRMRRRSPFRWKEINTDNDSAFLNHHLKDYCRRERIAFSRRRPYRKNDHARVEQKNHTHVRRPFGYLRYDTEEELKLINDLLENELRLYKNLFQPVIKTIRKERIGGKIKKIRDIPKTPFQRLIESAEMPKEEEIHLRSLYNDLNPAELKRKIDKKLDELYSLYYKKTSRGERTINPHRKRTPSTVTFLMSNQR